MICNVVNGKIVAPAETRTNDGWRLPTATAADVALALKVVRSSRPVEVPRLVAGLAEIGREGWLRDEDYRELAIRTGSPISFMRGAIRRFDAWLAQVDAYVRLLGEPWGNGCLRAGRAAYEGGVSTMIVMAGDSSSLPAWVLTQVLLANAPTIVKPSAAEPLAIFRFAEALLRKGLPCPHLLYLESSSTEGRELIMRCVKNTRQSVVFGEDATIAAIYGQLPYTPQHKAVPYWSGRSGVVLFADADVDAAARDIVLGATQDRGNRCNTTKKVFAPVAVAERLEQRLKEAADALRRGAPEDEATEMGRPDPVGRRQAEALAAEGEVLYDRDLLIVRCRPQDALLREEPSYPVIGIQYYDTGADPVELANATVRDTPSGRALVMAVFTEDRSTFDVAAARLRAFKVLHNCPSTTFDYSRAHQGMHLTLELMRLKECG